MMRTLLAGPYVGEIGWELMSWQAHVRRVFREEGFDRLVVLGSAGREAFYADMPLTYRVVDLSHVPGDACEDRRYDPQAGELVSSATIRTIVEPMIQSVAAELRCDGDDVVCLNPSYNGQILPCDSHHQRFIRFGAAHDFAAAKSEPESPWVVLIPRSRSLKKNENWPAATWDALADRLHRAGVRTTVFPPHAGQAIDMLARCDLAIGHSTGGLHLASLCGCPHVVWSWDDTRLWTPFEMTQRQRYETWWNPLGTPMHFHPVRNQPEVEAVFGWTMKGLERIGRRTGSSVTSSSFRSVWRFRTWLSHNVVRSQRFKRVPWPIQRFVRYGLI
jgi:hypothetical protein